MSGMEVVAVIGCVAAVVSAYKDGGKIVKSIKERRAAKKAPAPTESLETSLDRGPLAVGEARDSGIERYGPKFATGDQVATDALRNILIHLQGTLLRHLWVAQEDDNMTDFNILVDASDFGRIQSVTVLNELYMRMAQAAPLRHAAPPAPGRIETLEPALSFIPPWENHERAPQDTPLQPVYQAGQPTRPSQSPGNRCSSPGNESLGKSPTPRKKWGIFPASRLHEGSASLSPKAASSPSGEEVSMYGAIEYERTPSDSPLGIEFGEQGPPTWKPSSLITARLSSTSQGKKIDTSAATWKPSPELVIDEHNPWELEVSASTNVTNQRSPPALNTPQKISYQARRRSTELTLVNDSETTARESKRTQKDLPSQARSQPTPDVAPLIEDVASHQDSRRSQWKVPLVPRRRTTSEAAHATAKHDKTPKGSPIISRTQSSPQTPKNTAAKIPYGGFCKGAYKLQVNLEKESFKLRNSSTSMTGQSKYWACASSKCAFEGPALTIGKSCTFDNDVRLFKAVQYRWTFLAKSHVALAKVKDRKYHYQCVFCDRSNQAPTVYRCDGSFIEHISSHRSQHPATLLSEKVCCIAGRVAREDEDFDVNLMPHDDLPRVYDQASIDTPDSLKGVAAQIESLEDDGAFQWQTIDRSSGTSYLRDNSDASRTLHTLSSSSPPCQDGDWDLS